jgi:hypothetical protein
VIIPVTPIIVIITNGSSNNNSNNTGNTTSNASVATTNTSIYAYFPTTVSQAVMGGISVASYFKDAASMPLSSSLGMWGPLELVSFGG